MSVADVAVTCAGETLGLCPERALWWAARDTLLVADVHLGKESVFGRSGLAIPAGPTGGDLARLARLVERHGARRLVVLGDLVHAPPRPEDAWPAELSAWLDARPDLQVDVVAGNHDRRGTREALDARLRWHDEDLREGPFRLAHEPPGPAGSPAGYTLAGHVHPVLRLGSGRRDRLRAPVFWFREHSAILPSFGDFTGGFSVTPDEDDRLWAVGPDDVVPVWPPPTESSPRARCSP